MNLQDLNNKILQTVSQIEELISKRLDHPNAKQQQSQFTSSSSINGLNQSTQDVSQTSLFSSHQHPT
jgi:hypothetical protein